MEKIRTVIDPATLAHAEYNKVELPCLAAAKAARSLPEK
jgi:3-hydroxyacyl-CoA dehydrogenase